MHHTKKVDYSIYSFIYAFIHLFVYLFIYSFIYLVIYLFIYYYFFSPYLSTTIPSLHYLLYCPHVLFYPNYFICKLIFAAFSCSHLISIFHFSFYPSHIFHFPLLIIFLFCLGTQLFNFNF